MFSKGRFPKRSIPMSARGVFALCVLVSVALGFTLAWHLTRPSGIDLDAGAALQTPRPLAEFALVDHNGGKFTRDRFQGRWSLVFAGFTHCPDICPDTLWRLNLLDSRLRELGGSVQTVFLSVDPQRDTPEVMARYINHFNPRFVGATGEQHQIDTLCDSLGLAWIRIPGGRGEYTVDHSAALVLVDPKARVAGYFRPPFNVERIAADLAPLVGARG